MVTENCGQIIVKTEDIEEKTDKKTGQTKIWSGQPFFLYMYFTCPMEVQVRRNNCIHLFTSLNYMRDIYSLDPKNKTDGRMP